MKHGTAFSDYYVTAGIYKAHKKKLDFRNVESYKQFNVDLSKFGTDVALKCESMLQESDLDTFIKI